MAALQARLNTLTASAAARGTGVLGVPVAPPTATARLASLAASHRQPRAAPWSLHWGKRRGVFRRGAAAPEAPAPATADAGAAGSANNCVPAGAILGQPAAAAAAAAPPSGEAAVAAAVAAAAATVLQPAAPLPLPHPPTALPQPPAYPRVAALYSLSSVDEEELVEGHVPAAFLSSDGEEEGMVEGHLAPSISSRDDLEEMVHEAFEQEIENINQAVHEAFKQERAELDLAVGQTVQEAVQEAVESAVETAVENALLDRSFDVRANFNTLIALTGVILYWRGVWNLFDTWLGTDDLQGNIGSILIGMSVILLFRIFKLPLAEFW